MKRIRVAFASLAFLVLLGPSLAAQNVTVTELIVSGLPELEAKRIRALLPITEGSSFASIEGARRRAAFAKAYLGQDEGYAGVDIEVEEIEAGAIEVYVYPRPSTIAGLWVFESLMTTVPNFPMYGVGTGFSVGSYEQLLGLDIPLARWLSLDFAAGQSLSAAMDQALSGKSGLSLKAMPSLSAYAFAGMDLYPTSAGPWPRDGYAQFGTKLNLRFLSSLVLFGPSIEVSYRRAFLDFPYEAMRGKTLLSFKPFEFFWAEAMASLYFVSGKAAPLAAARSAGTRDLRLAPQAGPEERGLGAASLTANIALPLQAKLGFATLSFSLFGFVEASEAYSGLSGLGGLGGRPFSSYSPTAGGGLLLDFSPPFSLRFELGCGYSLETEKFAFVFRLL